MRFLLAALLAVVSFSANANPVCGPRSDVLAQLKANYGEVPVARALASNGHVLEVLKADDGSWTILLTSPSGLSCLAASGENWQEVEQKKQESGSLFHLAHEWIVQNNYRNVNGTLCCDETDCGYISNEQAWTAGIGSTVEVEIKGVKYNVVINSVYPSWDSQGRSVACTTGCLFRTSGY